MSVYLLAISGLLVISAPASGHVSLGTGNASLIGGDLSDPTDTVELSADTGAGLPEEKMIPKNAKWVKIRCAPTSGAYVSTGLQRMKIRLPRRPERLGSSVSPNLAGGERRNDRPDEPPEVSS